MRLLRSQSWPFIISQHKTGYCKEKKNILRCKQYVTKEDVDAKQTDADLRKSESEMNRLHVISDFRKVYANWMQVLYKLYRTRKVKDNGKILIRVKTRDTKKTIDISWALTFLYAALKLSFADNPRITKLSIDQNVLSFSYEGQCLYFYVGSGGDIFAPFNGEYDFLKVEGHDVIDIGANLGGSSIYFAIKGANKVISLEPYPYTFNLAKKNIEINKLNNKIELLNAGYGEDRKIIIDTSFIPNNTSPLKEVALGSEFPPSNGTETELLSLNTIISRFNLKSVVLKMDCEGCEYDLLIEDNDILKKFMVVQIEYHYGYGKLVEKLKSCGFEVKYTEPERSFNYQAGQEMLIGYIYAKLDSK